MAEKDPNNLAQIATRSKRSTAAGVVTGAAVLLFCLSQAGDYIDSEGPGRLMLAASVACALLSAAAIMFKPNREAKYYILYVGAVFLACPMLNIIAVERMNGNFLNELIQACWIDNYLICLLIYLAVFCICGSVRISAILISPAMFLFGLANMYVKDFRGEPLVPMDMGSVSTAMTVARGYTYSVGVDVSFAVAVTVLAMALAVRLSMPHAARKTKIVLRLVIALVVSTVAFCFYGTDLFVNWGYKPDFFNQMRGYNNKGALLGFTVNTRYLHRSAPEGYDPDAIEGIVESELAGYDGRTITEAALGKRAAKGKAKKNAAVEPDIIVIMDEAFSDLTINGEYETNRDPIPNMNALKKESLQGYAYVSVFGAGTSNTEFEFLTGDSMAFLPPASNAYQLYIEKDQPGLVRTLEKKGYTTHAFHPYFRGNWNRPRVYESMGFDDYCGIEDMFSQKFVNEYTNNPNAKYTLGKLLEEEGKSGDIFLRRYVSDAYDFSDVITRYEKRDKSKPYFMFNVTMQNHSPYDMFMDEKYRTVELEGLSGEYPKTEQYLQIIHQTDKALGDLIAYFKEADRPVIVLFFGDHQPSIENDFYTEVTGTDPNRMEGMQNMNRYATRFMLWANYDIPKGWVDMISVNYLQTMMLESAGIDITKYGQYLQSLYQKYPVITSQGAVRSGGGFVDAPGAQPDLSDYSCVIYNGLSDPDNRADIY